MTIIKNVFRLKFNDFKAQEGFESDRLLAVNKGI
ncbi:hypothetical protein SAMN05443373_104139 [Flavobacterium granuli]|uniref:Uncharacterized protein n=1 Tax=Flavobacterium granuli TaxID=280093 RepID=A0A1M5MTL0_9FLAO|nr:hypothetical protein SAMN05443373_104139 [Flavobacterium granuli]